MRNVLEPLSHGEVYTNGRLKINPRTGDIMEIVKASRPVFKAVAAEEIGGHSRKPVVPPEGQDIAEVEAASAALGDAWEAQRQAGLLRGARRAKKRVFDLAACNDFDMMITLTLDPEDIDRYDYKPVIRKLGQWLDNRVRRKGLRYLIVPELHKDGAIHFHGFINSEAVKLKPTRKRDKAGRKIFNVLDWTIGFTTAVFLDGTYEAACQYISKYVTKQVENGKGCIGGRYYLHGGELLEPIYKPLPIPFDTADFGRDFEIPEASLTLTYFTVEEYKQLFDGGICHEHNEPAPCAEQPVRHVSGYDMR